MKKISGVIVLMILLVLIGFGFTYKMVEPDGWDRIVEQVVEKVPMLENIIPEKTPEPTPTPPPTPTPENNMPAPVFTPIPNPTPTSTPDATPTPTPDGSQDVDFENMTYEIYSKLPAEIQEQYFRTYEDPMAFIQWYSKSKEEYDRQHITVEGDGSIDLGDYIN